jgi:MYXO-CTERM domain-containing protein
MTRRATPSLWLAVLLVVAGIGLGGVALAVSAPTHPAAHHPAAASVTPVSAVEAAVVPVRTEAGPGAGAQPTGGQPSVPMVAGLVALVGLVGVRTRRSAPADVGARHVIARHAVALRAPPSLQLA